jgi:SAM-dependent methyltransferase
VPDASDTYLHGHHDSVLRSHRWRTVENSAAYLIPRLSPGAHVLDVGCGPGTITIGFATYVGEGRVVGIDAAAEVLTGARSEAERQGHRNVSFEVGDLYDLSFDDGTFDVVHAHQVLQHLADPVAALVEMRRVCRPGGTVAARDGDYGGMFWFPDDPEMDEWRSLYQRTARAVDGEPDAGREMLAWAQLAGFSQIEASAGVWCFATPADRAWWGRLWADRMTQSTFADVALAHNLATEADLERLAGAWRRWASSGAGWFLVPHGEILCEA